MMPQNNRATSKRFIGSRVCFPYSCAVYHNPCR